MPKSPTRLWQEVAVCKKVLDTYRLHVVVLLIDAGAYLLLDPVGLYTSLGR